MPDRYAKTPTDPKPGSEAAGKLGCPVIDNHHGRGVPMGNQRQFWIAADCPLHEKEEE